MLFPSWSHLGGGGSASAVRMVPLLSSPSPCNPWLEFGTIQGFACLPFLPVAGTAEGRGGGCVVLLQGAAEAVPGLRTGLCSAPLAASQATQPTENSTEQRG